ncbi:MAG TPA: amino acid adenylation domain-containing protein, partial [Thermoanaerobaculia bacterium]|nr:amino acid adenylation domain-containing protein [Thermoanaerobaculia bacterium]
PTLERLLGHLRTLLAAAIAAPGERLSALPLLAPGERAQLLDEWNATGLGAPPGCLHEVIAAQAARTPERTAVVGRSGELTYGELVERAAGLARRLRALGAGPEARIAVCLERTPEMVVALLAVLLSGGAYVPLDPAYPGARLEQMLADSGAVVLLTQASLAGRLPAPAPGSAPCRIALLEDGPEAGEAPAGGVSEPPEPPEPLPGNLAYVIYTSGSTGRPKGVAIEHRSVVAFVGWAGEVFRPAELSAVLASTSICFDLSVFELFATLAHGGTVILAADALELPDLPAAGRVSLVNTVPSAMAELVRQGALPPGARTASLCGEPLSGSLADRLHATGTVERVWNLYGPTEDTVYSTWTLVAPGEAPLIGRPIAGTRVYLLDRGGAPVPVGVPGELLLGGAGLARGYLGQPERTAERFVPDPFSSLESPGGRLYRTGDLARFRPTGDLEFLGRLDHQVKIRGFRIELGEIEACLAEHPGVGDCAVLARRTGRPEAGGAELVAYLTAGDTPPATPALRQHLAGRLPAYMVPGVFVVLPAFPHTPNGKVDRGALARVAPVRLPGEGDAARPLTALEETVAGIWEEVLGAERTGGRVGSDDDFFQIGGHSLLATQVVSRLRAACGVEIPLRRLFETPTVAGLARAVETASAGAAPLARRPRPRETPAPPPPLAFGQERLWFLDQLAPGSATYNMPAALRLRGRLDRAALALSLGEIARRHETLRTTFAGESGEAVQVIAPPAPGPLAVPVADLAALPARAREEEARRLATAAARRPFDLRRGPLWRVSLLRLGAAEHLLFVVLHHIVADGWSLGVLVRELEAHFSHPVSDPLPELPIQYADFAAWQRDELTGEALEAQLAWWRRQLAGAPTLLELPTDRPRPAVQGFRGGSRPVRLDARLTAAVEGLARERGATPFMVLLAGLGVLLGRLSGQDDLLVGSAVANRTRRETEGLIGLFVNTLVLRCDLRGEAAGPAFSALLARTRESALGAYAHQDLPFERLVEALAPERKLAHSPLFQVFFTLQNAPLPELILPGLTLAPWEIASGTAKFDLTLSLGEEGGELAGSLEYDRDLFEAATVERWGGHLATLLAAAAAVPERSWHDLPLLSPAEEEELLAWNRTAVAYPPDLTLAGLFAAQAAETPGAPAVRFAGESLTYAELAERAGDLAARLSRL